MTRKEINKEVSAVLSIKKDFEWLNRKLKNIRDYLRDADVAEISGDAEGKDTNDEIHQSSRACAFSCSQLTLRYKMGRKIIHVKHRMRSFMEAADLTHSYHILSLSRSECGVR
ncbi:uncharacterized protein LOC131032071 [Cryptomeria japonica]|uniref:uncharacterized protein LOC131032071 n=1 Tax=Cryptomeria japonica TaxID=3369 RepID=UPI0027DA72CF|nr:uncharacterized protein LOC131032071 [Cryptomeria japonica]